MGTFSTLHSNKYADKLVKFKQGVLAEAAHAAGRLDEAEFTIAQGGICAAMSLRWLKERLSLFTINSAFSRSKGVGATDNKSGQKTLAKNVAPYGAFSTTWGASGSGQAYKELAAGYGLKIDNTNIIKTATILAAAQQIKAALKKKKGYVIAYNLIPSSAHATALYLDGDGRFHFFDPNAGEYKLKSDKFDEFFTEYNRILHESLNWTISALFCRAVTK